MPSDTPTHTPSTHIPTHLQTGPNVTSEGINLGPVKEGSTADSFLLPEDLVHLTRRSLFMIIDSDNSTAFSKLQVCSHWVWVWGVKGG